MNLITITYFVVFVFLSMAIFLFLDIGKDMQLSAITTKAKKQKQQSFKAQSRLKRKLIAAMQPTKFLLPATTAM